MYVYIRSGKSLPSWKCQDSEHGTWQWSHCCPRNCKRNYQIMYNFALTSRLHPKQLETLQLDCCSLPATVHGKHP